ncbi:MAG: PQQ-binding-like beta-propeller repeat protein [Pirellulaceae bacterium]|nr:PQQ-binding-like beta-propeller repeat protein [Pirellulaceae bacterium]
MNCPHPEINCLTRWFRQLAIVMFGLALLQVQTAAAETAQEIISAAGATGGFVVHFPCGDGQLTAKLRVDSRFQVQGLDRNADNVAKARRVVQSQGNYGSVSVDRLTGNRLPYIDRLVNLFVSEDLGDVPMSEVMRVLVPGGVAYVKQDDKWTKTVQTRPGNIDEWTHFLHDAGGNAVAHDDVVGPPRHLQWIGSPRWSRHHDRMASMSALVSTGGRIFYIMDEGSRISIQMPPRWTLIARDAFNGTLLWKQPIKEWHSHLWPLKSGPTALARRLVAIGDRVYVTLGLKEPVSVLDAATGEVVQTLEATRPTEEFIVSNGTVLALVNKGKFDTGGFTPAFNTGDQKRVREERKFHWNQLPREVVAMDAATGEQRWKLQSKVAPLTLAADDDRVYFHDDQKVVCLDRQSGKPQWDSAPAGRRKDVTMNFGPKLVVHDGILLFAGGDRLMHAVDASTGKPLWEAPHARGGYQSPEDLLVASGLVWSAPTTSGRDSGVFTGRDLRTGKVINEFPPNVDTYWFHHRCYIAKATDKFLLPSRTGIEFVDHKNQDWDIHHWVRGGCLYGIMPCNGLVYAPPHNCACYPEAKLFGLNALAPASVNRQLPAEVAEVDESARLERGPAFGTLTDAAASKVDPSDWPTYRHDASRSGFSGTQVPTKLKPQWESRFAGKLSSVVVADGTLFVAEVDAHTLHALDADTGKIQWSYTTGGRVDSPPTLFRGGAVFGSADGWVYCVRASDGELVWRFRAAPRDERLMAFEQLESVWPVHGSVLIESGVVYFVAGRSSFLDGGMRFFRLDAETGRKISEGKMDDRDPHTGEDMQDHIKVLQMPVALPDILSTDSVYVYLRSQQIDMEGNRLEIGPNAADFAAQASVQRGETAHLFAPMGFLDDTWFHRSYWVYGRSFAGGHGGYYQAGKYAPSGRLLVFDDKDVYGFGRKSEYLKWTTTIEHQLFATSKEAPPEARSSVEEKVIGGRRRPAAVNMVQFKKTPSLNPQGKPLTVEAWFSADRPDGVILARGGPTDGYALALRGGKPRFVVRSSTKLAAAVAKVDTIGRWTHVAGVLDEDLQMRLYINGNLAASAVATKLLGTDPAQSLEIGADDASAVGDYNSPLGFTGMIDEVRIYHSALSADEISLRASSREKSPTDDKRLVLACTFEGGTAEDASGHKNDGTLAGAQSVKGKFGRGVQFAFRRPRSGNAGSASFVRHRWNQDIPLLVRAMVKTGDTIFVAGPPDVIDEEKTFARIMARDPRIAEKLAEQDVALVGGQGGVLQAVSAKDGSMLGEYQLDWLPSWDGMAAAQKMLFVSTTDGRVICLGE